jgi:hypothetical protein
VAKAPLVAGGRVWVESDVFDIDHRIKHGDESGWRGDPTMRLSWNPANRMFEVWATDLGGTDYIAASHDECNHVLLQKLVAGDPQKFDVIQGVLDTNRRLAAEREAAHKERRMEAHEKLQWGIRQDFGHLLGGKQGVHSMYVPKQKKAG